MIDDNRANIEDIKYGNKDATEEEVQAAVEIANAKHVVEKLEKGEVLHLVPRVAKRLSKAERRKLGRKGYHPGMLYFIFFTSYLNLFYLSRIQQENLVFRFHNHDHNFQLPT